MSETTTKTETKSRPILFSGPMVRAIHAGQKTQTRRVVKLPPDIRADGFFGEESGPFRFHVSDLICPYGAPGDELWVREEHYRFGHWEPVPGVRTKSGRHQKWQFVGDSDEVLFECPFELSRSMNAPYQSRPGWYKRLARFMPRWASRLTLTVTGVRAERLQDISHEDALAEGIKATKWATDGLPLRQQRLTLSVLAYSHLWEEINGSGSWAENPWVWVVEFERKAVGS